MSVAALQAQSHPLSASAARRIPELDGLRGLAIGMVLLWHFYYGTVEPAPGSLLDHIHSSLRLMWSGVDLFFVLSGFLIGGILIDNREASNYFRTFYRRRFFRIVPAYLVCVTAFYVLIRLIESGHASKLGFLLDLKLLPWAPHFFFLQNFWMAAWNTSGVMVITWSLCIEEQFYLTLPALVRYLSPRRLLVLACSTITLAPCLRVALMLIWPGHRWAAFVLLPTRADTLMLGVLGAIVIRTPQYRIWIENHRRAFRLALLSLGAGVFAFLRFSWFYTGFLMQAVGYTWLATFYLFVLLHSLTFSGQLSQALRWKPLGRLGTLAYGIYLYHEIVLWVCFGFMYSFWPRIRGAKSFFLSLFVLLFIWFISEVSWRYFEQPLLRFGQRSKYQFATSPTAAEP